MHKCVVLILCICILIVYGCVLIVVLIHRQTCLFYLDVCRMSVSFDL